MDDTTTQYRQLAGRLTAVADGGGPRPLWRPVSHQDRLLARMGRDPR